MDQMWTGFVFVILMSLIGAYVKLTNGAINRRLDENERDIKAHADKCEEVPKGELLLRLNGISDEQVQMRNTMHWFGDCIQVIGVKDGVMLPPRPIVRG